MHTVLIFLDLVTRDLEALDVQHYGTTKNLTKKELDALLTLEKNKELTIKASDKGGSTVVLNSD